MNLVEFGGLRGRLTLTGQELNPVQERLMEPARVTLVRRMRSFHLLISSQRLRRSISLTMVRINNIEKNGCELLFTQSLHVRVVFRQVARTLHLPLKEIYIMTNWPTYEDVTNQQSDSWNTIPLFLREAILNSGVRYDSWRIRNIWVLSSSRLVQNAAFYFAVAIIRQFECMLKRWSGFPVEQSLSMQDLINHIPRHLVNQFGILSLENACRCLEHHGVLSASDGPPLTFIQAAPTPRVS
ncbi:unnamed protein product [Arabis nemorensis]|uniref:Uncharacterized protein n=1 Tax=Arabis nemorensis TaxID=586526 RepID=A0A565B2Q0_9BRAS|nr:unnamed protein product [Arabis nemorensis]